MGEAFTGNGAVESIDYIILFPVITDYTVTIVIMLISHTNIVMDIVMDIIVQHILPHSAPSWTLS